MENLFHITDDVIYIEIKAIPGASKTCFAGIKDNRLRVRIAAAPENGKANSELIDFIAGALGCAKRDVSVTKGEKSRLKTVSVPAAFLPGLNEIFQENYQFHK